MNPARWDTVSISLLAIIGGVLFTFGYAIIRLWLDAQTEIRDDAPYDWERDQ